MRTRQDVWFEGYSVFCPCTYTLSSSSSAYLTLALISLILDQADIPGHLCVEVMTTPLHQEGQACMSDQLGGQ